MSPTVDSLGSGRYTLEALLGSGGAAQVYRARDTVLDRAVAVKLLRDVTDDPASRERFTAEARTLAGLSHPGLVPVLDAGTDGDRPYLVMELVDGTTLARRLSDGAVDAATVGAQVAAALAYVHGCGIVHRDVTPGNILLGGDERVRLADFGIAQLMTSAGRLTAPDQTIGTAAYLSPEQVRGDRVTPASDVYSLGLVLLEALTGARAFAGPPLEAAVARLTRQPEIPADLPDAWSRLLRRMTATDPTDRPSASALATELAELASDDTDPVRRPSPAPAESATSPLTLPATVVRRRRRSRLGVGAALASGLVVAVLVAVLAAALGAGREGSGDTDIPPNLPPGISSDLQDLHEAVNE
jgi:serine/threonine protein kinase